MTDLAEPEDRPGRAASESDPEPQGQSGLPAVRAELAQAERDEEWALLVLVGWIALLAFILVILVSSPWPWGAALGLLVWAAGAQGVFQDFSASVERTRALRTSVEQMEREGGKDPLSA